MTKWKKQSTHTLITLQPHHRWSRWYSALEQACTRLGLPWGKSNHYDSWCESWSTVYYTSAEALAHVGGMKVLHEVAEGLHREAMAPSTQRWLAGEAL